MSIAGIVCALAREARHFNRVARHGETVATLADGSLLALNGMGDAPATRAAETLVEAGATALVSWGMAGGLDPALRSGSIVLPTEVVAYDGSAWPTTRSWHQKLCEALGELMPVAGGRLLSVPRIMASAAEKARALRDTHACAVDMESMAVAHVAAARGLPFVAVRVIVDTSEDSLPGSALSAVGDAHLQVWRLLRALALRPAEVPALVRLAVRYRAADKALAAIVRSCALAPCAFSAVHPARVP